MPIARFQMPDGRVARFDVPEGTTPEQAQAQMEAQLKTIPEAQPDQYEMPSPLQAGVDASVDAVKGFGQSVSDMFTGNDRQTRATRELPELGQGGLLASQDKLKVAAIAPVLLTTTNPREIGQILSSQFPEIGITEDEKGNLIANDNKTGIKAVINKPGWTQLDTLQALGITAAYAPTALPALAGTGAAKITGKLIADRAIKGGVRAGLTETAIQGGQAAAGGEFNPEDVAISAVTGGLAEAAIPAVKGFAQKRVASKEAIDKEIGKETADIIENNKPKSKLAEEIGVNKADVEPELKSYDEIKKVLQKKDVNKLAEKADIDIETLKALDELGIVTNPDAYSKNFAFIDVQQALKDRPGNPAANIEMRSIARLGEEADNLIRKLGGTTDKSMLDIKVRDQVMGRINNLEKRANNLYKGIVLDPKKPELGGIPKETKLTAKASKDYIDDVLSTIDGDRSQLSPVEKKIVALFEKDEGMHAPPSKRDPTYAMVDRLRKDVGNALSKKTDVFKDDSEGTLKRIYAVLSEDQQGVADAFGVGRRYALARKVVSTRKGLEDAAKKLVGKDLEGSIVPKLKAAGNAISSGDASKFNALMKSLPRNKREEAAATMLGDIFTKSGGKGKGLGQGFVAAWETLNRNKAAKNILFNNLPKGSMERFDRLGLAAKGIFRAINRGSKSNSANPTIVALEKSGIINKVLDAGEALGRVPVVGQVSGAGLVKHVARPKDGAQAASELLSSAKFKQAVLDLARNKEKQAESTITNSKAYKDWFKSITPENKKQIAANGFFQWLVRDNEQEKNQ